jgi:putative DNA primase/helicase
MRRRLIVVRWTEKIPEAEQREFEEFVAELLTEGPAILNWLIEGAIDYLHNGLFVADADREFTESYFEEMDPVGQFIAACVAPETDHHEKARDVFNAYVAWALANAKLPMKETRFGRIARKKLTRDDTGRYHVYRDVRLHNVPERPADSDLQRSAAVASMGPAPPAEEIAF